MTVGHAKTWILRKFEEINSILNPNCFEIYVSGFFLKAQNQKPILRIDLSFFAKVDEEKVNKQALLEDVFVQVYKSTPKMMHIPICQLQK